MFYILVSINFCFPKHSSQTCCSCDVTLYWPLSLSITYYLNGPFSKKIKPATYYAKQYDYALRQSHTIVCRIRHTTDSIRHVVGLNCTTYDTKRLYASVVLQVSTILYTVFFNILLSETHITVYDLKFWNV